jgi:hypothetical protein
MEPCRQPVAVYKLWCSITVDCHDSKPFTHAQLAQL